MQSLNHFIVEKEWSYQPCIKNKLQEQESFAWKTASGSRGRRGIDKNATEVCKMRPGMEKVNKEKMENWGKTNFSINGFLR